VLSISTGHSVRYLTDAVAKGRENYYTQATDAGEPPGLWYGAGAEALGLSGEVNAVLMESLYTHLRDPRDPRSSSRRTWDEADPLAAAHRKYRSAEDVYKGLLEANPDAGPEERAALRVQAERSARQAVAFIDATFSAPKSVTVLAVAFERAASEARAAGNETAAQAWDAHSKAVEDAVLAGARASIDYLQEHAGYSRVGHHGGGAGRWIDAHEFVVAQFLQHDSRDKDPQLHVHQAILNRVLCADGEWRTLDSRAIHALRGAAGAIAERVMEAHLTRSLGVEFATRPDGRAREVLGVSQDVMDLFSSRRRAVTARTREMIAEFQQTYGREPSPAERYYFAQQATLATRAAKSHSGETRAEQLARWTEQCGQTIGTGLAQVAQDVLARSQQAGEAARWSPRDVVTRALAGVAEAKQAWTRSALMRAVSDALPGNLRIGPDEVLPLLDGLTDDALAHAVPVTEPADTTNLPESELLANGQSPYSAPAIALYTTEGQMSAEHALRAALVLRGAVAFSTDEAQAVLDRFATSGRTLGVDQAAALRGVLTSGAQVEVISAAPGTGKSFVVGALAEAWAGVEERRVFGLTPSQVAAGVLAEEGVTAATNTAAWLGAQGRLTRGGPVDAADEAWRLRAGDLVVVDEANMASTDHLAAVQARCAEVGAKLLLVGDPRQLGAVGPGGAFIDLAERSIRYELADVRRFTSEWERAASLRLRDGDVGVLGEYAKHGRLRDGGTVEQAEAAASRAWLADTLRGWESLLMVRDNNSAARVSAELRTELVALGKVAEAGVPLGRPGWEGVVAGVGDLVQARRNGWELIGFEGNERAPINRDTYRVTGLRPDGGLTVARIVSRGQDGEVLGDPLALPASYVAAEVTLGYASTVHAAEGRTVDSAHSVTDQTTSLPGLLVPLTRGREANTAWVVTTSLPADAETGQTLEVEPRTPAAVLADIMEGHQRERSALAEQEQAEIDARSTMTHVDRLVDVVSRVVTTGRTAATLDRLTADGALTADQREALAADEAFGSLERLLRTAELAGHDPDAVLTSAIEARDLHGARSLAQVLHARISDAYAGRLTPRIAGMSDLIPADVPREWGAWLRDRADAADTRRHELGAETAEEAPAWAVDTLGPVPSDEDVMARQEWEHRAGWAAAYRELVGYNDDRDPLGHAPAPGLMEKAALFRAAHEALGSLDAGADEARMTEGRLRARYVAFQREEAWAPRSVADDLDALNQAAEQARTDATVWAARAEAPDVDESAAAQLRADADAAERQAEDLAARAAELEQADEARAEWFLHTAVTRENAHRSGMELRARGIDPDNPADRVTADEWLEEHHIEQTTADRDREIVEEYELHDERADEQLDDSGPVAAPAPADIRETSTTDPTERQDPAQRRRIVPVDETTQLVTRAQASLAEIAARRESDAAREAEENAHREELARWSGDAAESTADDGEQLTRQL